MPVDQHNDPSGNLPGNPFEDRLSAALHQAGGTFDTDRAALAAGGAVRGRRRQLLRRTAVLGGAAGIALVGVGGALLVPWGGKPDPQPTSVAAKPRPTKATATPGPFSGDDMIRTLETLLPQGKFTKQQARGTDDSQLPPYATVVYDDGKGASAISVGVSRIQPGSDEARQTIQCPDKVFIPSDGCATTRLADGSGVMVHRGYEYPDKHVDTKLWRAELITPTGQHVSVQEWNAAAEKDAPVTRPEPALSVDQLKQLAAAKEWREIADALPAPQQSDVPTAPAGDGKALVRTFTRLLPKGLKVVDHSGEDTQFGYLVVDDGKGPSFVQINVQPDMSDVAGDLFGADSETLADGTRVATHQGPGEKGGSGVVMWTVDTMRPDGRRVVISAFNAPSQITAASRSTPALTMKQLREIALSPQWLKLG
ncbi:hypothetical protein [Streptomyces sp. NPDC001315]|uniref:hypothetical protein n=1 Tax=Streptomyces sp. NPDC001315 TaxID=3364562 RepID=UPI0036741C3F